MANDENLQATKWKVFREKLSEEDQDILDHMLDSSREYEQLQEAAFESSVLSILIEHRKRLNEIEEEITRLGQKGNISF